MGRKRYKMKVFKAIVKTEIRPYANLSKRASVLGFVEQPDTIDGKVIQALIRRQFEALVTNEYASDYANETIIYVVSGEIVGDGDWLNIQNAVWIPAKGIEQTLVLNSISAPNTNLTQPDVTAIRKVQADTLVKIVKDILDNPDDFDRVEDYVDYQLETANGFSNDLCFLDSYEDEEFGMKIANIRIFDVKASVNVTAGTVVYINDLLGIPNTTSAEALFEALDELTFEDIYKTGYHRSYNKFAGRENEYSIIYPQFTEDGYDEIFGYEDYDDDDDEWNDEDYDEWDDEDDEDYDDDDDDDDEEDEDEDEDENNFSEIPTYNGKIDANEYEKFFRDE
jgi:hypothetical protein